MNIGITGHTGFIGSHLCRALDRSYGNYEVLDRKKYNLLDVEGMEEFVRGKDIIFHLAGVMRASNEEIIFVNTGGTTCLLEAIKRYSEAESKIIFASSLQVYGSTADTRRLRESDNLQPSSIYGLSKQFAEAVLRNYYGEYGIRSIVFRFSSVFGPEGKPYYNCVIPTFIDLILKQETLIVNGNGEQGRDFIYIDDIIEALINSIEYESSGTEIFNICSGEMTSINQLVRILEEKMQAKANVEYRSSKEKVNFLIGDPTKAQKKLGFRCTTSLGEGLEKTIRWFKRRYES